MAPIKLVIKLNGRPICKRKFEIEDNNNGLQEEKSLKKDYLNGKSGLITCMKTVGRHSLYNHRGRYTRLRPYVRDFLEQVCQKFELYVYTKGQRWYAKEDIIKWTSLLPGSGELLSCASIIGLIQGMHVLGFILLRTQVA
ncbi:uncharacterized protein LOC113357432 isoform X3 [Papaver somniferum]|uniref:uncharacterized protein LOC113357432 isoform X3 n=1 Tax=Papaver somniferum TaxID=3469 RepID=UPI000E700AFF|nr:uncharacterized protein LOC113357432 isoform X3 [Papaver somniferum]XP_026456605.1 uncharacterized protein LOC113357432 isoform X3 [Papaver somniferum]